MSSQPETALTQTPSQEEVFPEEEEIKLTNHAEGEIKLTDHDKRNLYMQLVITEMQVLYTENITRVSERNTLLLSIVTIAGALLSVGVQKDVIPQNLSFFFPIIAFFIALAWDHNNDKIGDNSTHIRVNIEQKHGYAGMQTRRFQGRVKRNRLPRWLAVRVGKQNIAALGLFLAIDILNLISGGLRISPLSLLAWFFTVMTVVVIRHDRSGKKS